MVSKLNAFSFPPIWMWDIWMWLSCDCSFDVPVMQRQYPVPTFKYLCFVIIITITRNHFSQGLVPMQLSWTLTPRRSPLLSSEISSLPSSMPSHSGHLHLRPGLLAQVGLSSSHPSPTDYSSRLSQSIHSVNQCHLRHWVWMIGPVLRHFDERTREAGNCRGGRPVHLREGEWHL